MSVIHIDGQEITQKLIFVVHLFEINHSSRWWDRGGCNS